MRRYCSFLRERRGFSSNALSMDSFHVVYDHPNPLASKLNAVS
jgi:hypothetical protein